MYIEFSHYLHALAQSAGQIPDAAKKAVFGVNRSMHGLLVDIDHCPRASSGEVASPIAFQLSAFCRDSGYPEKPFSDPEFFAQAIAAAAALPAPFALEIAGGGFVNGVSNEPFVAECVAAFASAAPEAVCSTVPLTACSSGAGSGVSEDLLGAVDWPRLLASTRNRADEDMNEFLQARSAAVSYDPQDRLMLLGLLAEPELSCRPFLRGLGGMQNVPWYFERFACCLAAFGAGSSDIRTDGSTAAKLYCAGRSRTSSVPVERFVAGQTKLLLDFRGRVLLGPSELTAVRLVRWCFDTAKNFFSFYNYPGSRQLSPSEPAAAAAAELARASGALVAHSLRRVLA